MAGHLMYAPQCGGTVRNGPNRGKRCTQPAVRGRERCRVHGGKIPKVRNYYSKNAGPKLRPVLEALAAEGPEERFSVSRELDVLRVDAERAVRLYAEAMESEDGALRAAASTRLRDSMQAVVAAADKAARIHAASPATFSAEELGWVAGQYEHVVQRVVGIRDPELARMLIEEMGNVRLPERTAGGSATPADVARAMREFAEKLDKSVPGEDE